MPIEEINFDYVDESTNCKGVLFLPESFQVKIKHLYN